MSSRKVHEIMMQIFPIAQNSHYLKCLPPHSYEYFLIKIICTLNLKLYKNKFKEVKHWFLASLTVLK